jgi:Polyketide cyclase / dehydrase and lipid transport
MRRSITRSISINAPPQVVLGLVADPTELARWAPAFARAARPAGGDRWRIDTGDGEWDVRVRVSPELGTVDFLMADAPRGVEIGVFARVLRNGCGSELVFTRFFPDSMSEIEVAEQKAVVAVELQTVRALCESGHAGKAAA